MRITMFFLFAGICLCQANSSYSQVTNFSLYYNNKTVKHVLKEIEKQSEFIFFYHDDHVNVNRKVTLKIDNENIETILDELFLHTNNKYVIKDRQIFITKDEDIPAPSQQQRKRVTGQVLDDTGNPLIGVNVMVRNTSNGTITNIDGLYVIDVSDNETLQFSYIGFVSQEVKVDNKEIINVVLTEDTNALEEVVVVGYGSQKKTSVVSAINSIGQKEITVPGRSVTNGLAGRIAGLYTIQRTGEPGHDNAEFWIRGVSSFSGGTAPLVLVDGVPRSMNNIEADEIDTFTVLKDAAATAVYGAEGANGVILITTKRGLTAKPVITFRGEYSQSRPTKLPKFVDSWDYLELANEALMNDGFSPQFEDELIAKYRNREDSDLYPNSKWMDELLRKHYDSQRYNLNVRGGTETAKYFVSLAYYTEEGVFKSDPQNKWETNIGLDKYNLRSNIDLKITKSTSINIDVSGQYLYRTNPNPEKSTDDLFAYIIHTPSYIFPAVYSDGTIATYEKEHDSNNRNPYNLLMNAGYSKNMNTQIQTSIGLKQDLDFITPGLNLRGKIGFDYDGTTLLRRTWNPSRYYATGRDESGNLTFNEVVSGENKIGDLSMKEDANSVTRKIYMEASLNYNRIFGNHNVGGMLLYMQKETQQNKVALAYRKQGMVGRITYAYDDRYFAEANFGYTGSESFAAKHRFGFFPAFGLGYYISNESFYPTSLMNVMNKLKVRASYGRTGNDDTGGARFLYRATFKMDGHTFDQGIGDNGGTNPVQGNSNGVKTGINDLLFENTTIQWEVETKKNIGIDLGLFNNKVEITADYFKNRRSSILMQRNTISQVAGFNERPWQNYGIVDSWGYDMEGDIRQNLGPVKMTLKGTFTFSRNKIIERDEVEKEYPWLSEIGRKNGSRQLYIAERLYTDDDFIITPNDNGTFSYELKPELPQLSMANRVGPGDIKFKDLNDDGIIDSFDKSYEGVKHTKTPEIVYGFGINLEYKNFYMSAYFQGVSNTQTVLASGNNTFWPFNWGVDKSNYRTAFLDRWTPENPNQNVMMPRLHSHYNYNLNKEENTWWVRDFSFIRFKNLEIGYNIPKSVTQKFLASGARVYMMGYNIYCWDKLGGLWDPELGNDNKGNKYPLPRTFTFGIELNF